ncbi:MAG: hypothetical protein HYY78_18395 [Betaproteobacteria bacterium]|nr:hypothetical protein [Betaproteobacteria bacterium]
MSRVNDQLSTNLFQLSGQGKHFPALWISGEVPVLLGAGQAMSGDAGNSNGIFHKPEICPSLAGQSVVQEGDTAAGQRLLRPAICEAGLVKASAK